jgi:hypothetical protein
MRFTDLQIARILTLTAVIDAVQPDCPLPLLPSWNRNQALLDAWRSAFDAPHVVAARTGLGALLAQAACLSANHPHKRKRRDRSPAPVILPNVGV